MSMLPTPGSHDSECESFILYYQVIFIQLTWIFPKTTLPLLRAQYLGPVLLLSRGSSTHHLSQLCGLWTNSLKHDFTN